MKKVTLSKAIEEFFPDGTVPYDPSQADKHGIRGPSSATIDRFPYWPPDLFAAMAVLIERSGAYSYWDPSDPYLLEISLEAQRIGDIWREHFLGQETDHRYREIRKALDDDSFRENDYEPKQLANYFLQRQWEVLVSDFADHSLSAVESGGDIEEWCYAAISLMIAADEASRDVASTKCAGGDEGFEQPFGEDFEPTWAQAFFQKTLFGDRGSQFLSKESASRIWRKDKEVPKGVFETLTFRFDSSLANVLPKMRTPQLGATLRAFSHYLCLLPGSQEVITTWYQSPTTYKNNRVFNILAVPFPYSIPTKAFKPIESPSIDLGRWGGFSIEQEWLNEFGSKEEQPQKFVSFLKELLENARQGVVGEINAIVFPEASISPAVFEEVVEYLTKYECNDVEILIAGVAGEASDFLSFGPENARATDCDVNLVGMAHFAPPIIAPVSSTDTNVNSEAPPHDVSRVASVFYQPKHHRWRIDKSQMEAYGLAARLGGVRYRWENISTDLRHIQILPIRTHGVLATLVCEDLARVDPCQSVLRSIGPNLVVALLMDGPQLNARWPGRYATILAEDPGSSVLSLTSVGLVDRNNQFSPFDDSHVVGLWRDLSGQVQTIELKPGSSGVVLSVEARSVEEWTMDDRSDGCDAVSFELVQVTQIAHENVNYKPFDKEGLVLY